MKQMSFDELEWKRRQEAYKEAGHGYKRKAERRLQEFVHSALQAKFGPKAKQRRAA